MDRKEVRKQEVGKMNGKKFLEFYLKSNNVYERFNLIYLEFFGVYRDSLKTKYDLSYKFNNYVREKSDYKYYVYDISGFYDLHNERLIFAVKISGDGKLSLIEDFYFKFIDLTKEYIDIDLKPFGDDFIKVSSDYREYEIGFIYESPVNIKNFQNFIGLNINDIFSNKWSRNVARLFLSLIKTSNYCYDVVIKKDKDEIEIAEIKRTLKEILNKKVEVSIKYISHEKRKIYTLLIEDKKKEIKYYPSELENLTEQLDNILKDYLNNLFTKTKRKRLTLDKKISELILLARFSDILD